MCALIWKWVLFFKRTSYLFVNFLPTMKLCELREYKCSEYVTIAVESQFKQLRSSLTKRFFGASTGFEPVASAFVL